MLLKNIDNFIIVLGKADNVLPASAVMRDKIRILTRAAVICCCTPCLYLLLICWAFSRTHIFLNTRMTLA